MLQHPTISKLQALRLNGMVKALEQQAKTTDVNKLSFEERLGMLVDNEIIDRENRKLTMLIKAANLKQAACLEDLDFDLKRGIDKAVITNLSLCQWIKEHHNVFITGSTGCGKTYLACAIANKVCQNGFSALYLKVSKLFSNLTIARQDGSYKQILAKLAKIKVLILDDFGLVKPNYDNTQDLLEIIDDRYDTGSLIITSQLPSNEWYGVLENLTLADAILDRIIHRAYNLKLKGETKRKNKYKQN